MNASFLPRLRLFGAVSVLMFVGCAAMAQVEEDAAPPAAESAPAAAPSAPASKPDAKPAGKKAEGAHKSGDKSKSDGKADKPKSEGKKASAPKSSGGYATEAEASAHCSGNVVWVGEDHFNHYPGSREYGKKPGSFQCEK